MSDAADRMAKTRLAIIAHVQSRERVHERRPAIEDREQESGEPDREDEGPGRLRGWFGRIRRVVGTWWRHHPAHAGVEMATPMLSSYARQKPVQYLGLAALLGVVVVLTRPWRVISLTSVLVALMKSSQLSSVVLSAMSAADYGQDPRPPV